MNRKCEHDEENRTRTQKKGRRNEVKRSCFVGPLPLVTATCCSQQSKEGKTHRTYYVCLFSHLFFLSTSFVRDRFRLWHYRFFASHSLVSFPHPSERARRVLNRQINQPAAYTLTQRTDTNGDDIVQMLCGPLRWKTECNSNGIRSDSKSNTHRGWLSYIGLWPCDAKQKHLLPVFK